MVIFRKWCNWLRLGKDLSLLLKVSKEFRHEIFYYDHIDVNLTKVLWMTLDANYGLWCDSPAVCMPTITPSHPAEPPACNIPVVLHSIRDTVCKHDPLIIKIHLVGLTGLKLQLNGITLD